VRTTPYWKFGGGYSYRTPRSKKTQWIKHLKDVPKTARDVLSAKQEKPKKNSPKKRRTKTITKKKTKSKKGGFRLPGGLGPKGILQGVLALAIVPRFIPVQSPGARMLGSGLALRAINLGGGGALSSAGLIMMAGEFLAPYLGGFIGAPGAPAGNAGGFDY